MVFEDEIDLLDENGNLLKKINDNEEKNNFSFNILTR